MGFYTINSHKVFITLNSDAYLRKILLKNKSAEYKIGSKIRGSDENTETDVLMFKYLQDEYHNDPHLFMKNWVLINLEEEEARSNIWHILYDYCYLNPIYKLVPVKDSIELILDDYKYSDPAYPMGDTFYLTSVSQISKWWELLFGIKKEIQPLFLYIEPSYIKKIVGTLDELKIYGEHFILDCRFNITIYPPEMDFH